MYYLFFMKHSVKDQMTKYTYMLAQGLLKMTLSFFFWRIFIFHEWKNNGEKNISQSFTLRLYGDQF